MQTYVERKNFSFFSKALSEDTFEVVKFSGRQAISQPYEFTITLSAHDSDIDLKGVLRNPATLMILGGAEVVPINGVLKSFEQMHEANQRVFYRAVLVPKLWHLGLYRENRLFLDKSVPQILDEVLKQSGLTSADYELKLTRNYPAWEYVCQYAESNLDFISRWMEREGIYYFFKQTPNGEKVVITDNSSVHEDVPGLSMLPYSPAAGLVPEEDEVVTGLISRQQILPKKVILKDYNYRKPTLDVRAEADVDPNGREDVYIYGEHFKDPSQGKELASIRAGEFLCRETMYYGQATSPQLAPGFLFELAGHYRGSCNRRFLITEVEHHGRATGVLLAGLGDEERDAQPGYSNSFVCIPSSTQFRPERKTSRPRINGMMNAVIDAAGDGSTAELDDQGRYKVILPFDLSGRSGGKASRWVRMAQPYSGSDYGMHFPLHKGAEVLLTFIDGDIDRPIISGAVPNPNTQSPVTNANQTKSVIRDKFGNEIIMDATPGDEHIRLHSPHHRSFVNLGRSWECYTGSDWTEGNCGNRGQFGLGTNLSAFLGTTLEAKGGFFNDITVGLSNSVNLTGTLAATWGYSWSYFRGPKMDFADGDVTSIAEENNIVSADKVLCLVGGAGEVTPGKADNTSIIRADEDSIELAVGDRKSPEKGEIRGSLKLMLKPEALAAASSLALVAASVASVKNRPGWEKGWAAGCGTPALALAALATYSALRVRKQLNDPEFTPQIVAHENPKGTLEIRKDGSIHLNSNSEDKQQKQTGKIVMGVGMQQDVYREKIKKQIGVLNGQLDSIEKGLKQPLGKGVALNERKNRLDEHKRTLQYMVRHHRSQKQAWENARITLLEDRISIACGTPGSRFYESTINLYKDGQIILVGKQIKIQTPGKESTVDITSEGVRLKGKSVSSNNQLLVKQ